MATATATVEEVEPIVPQDGPVEPGEARKTPSKPAARKAHPGEPRKQATRERFFLGAGSGDGVPLAGTAPCLGKEMDSETEALLTAFKTGVSFFVVTEWTTISDTSGGTITLRKEQVQTSRVSSGPKSV